VKPAPFDLVTPGSIAEACAVLAEAGGGATVIAGGQTLMPLLNLRMSQPFILVDINKVPGLSGIAMTDGGIRVGPATCQREALESPLLARELPVMVQALGHVGHHQTRNRGTVGGSVALGEPAAELPATALALGAEIEARSSTGSRLIPVEDFYLAPYTTTLEPDELVTAIHFPDWPADTVTVVHEVARRPGDFALVGLVAAFALDAGVVRKAGIAWFGMGPTPMRSRAAEQALIGADRPDWSALADLAVSDTEPLDDAMASASYRRTVAARIFARQVAQALGARETA